MTRSIELFFFLLNCERPVHKDQIIDVFWPDPGENIDQTFRSTIHYLRKAIGEECIVSKSGTYELTFSTLSQGQVWYDVAIFEQRFAEAKKAMEQGDEDTAKATFQSMIELYLGDYVQSFYSSWCTFRRDELKRMYTDGRRELARLAWRQELFDECIMHWQQLLAIDLCLEEAHYGLMCCYVRQGKRSMALRQYRYCEATLQQELSVTPGSNMQRLYYRLTHNKDATSLA